MKSSKPKLLKELINKKNAVLILENGNIYWGNGVGKKGKTIGELCFNTSMTGYQEIISDPSYADQIITFTFPHIGNTGTNLNDNESDLPVAKGIILKANITSASNFRSELNLQDWLIKKNIIGIQGIDTRSITSLIRENGYINGMIVNEDINDKEIKQALKSIKSWSGLKGADLASKVTCQKKYSWNKKSFYNRDYFDVNSKIHKTKTKSRVVVIDFGVKQNILRMLADRNFNVIVVPLNTSYENIIKLKPDGIFLSNGPGDPKATSKIINNLLIKLFKINIPIYGICLGHQLIALALGAETEKMQNGHRGANQPVRFNKNNKVEITSQNHGFVVKRNSLSKTTAETYTSLFDGVVEGIKVKNKPIFSVQYHPEASPGPHDTYSFFDSFYNEVNKIKKKNA
jgi:carbamoyl-phosphate synthase small subunit